MKENTSNSSVSKRLLYVLAGIIIILAVFKLGIFVGFHQASFYDNRNSNYFSRGLSDPRSMFSPFMMRDEDDIVNPHGAIGIIASVRLPTLLVKGPDTAEQIVIVSSTTTIRRFRDAASTTDLHAGDQVIVIGEPDQYGSVHATFIRVMPDPNNSTSTLP